jgi:muramoyltetrapeptide carboxypeptidase
MRKPRALRAGDRIAIVAPASGCGREAFDSGVAELRRLGFDPTWDEAVFVRSTFTAGTAAARAEAFARAWRDPSVAALVALRGGYGSVHLLPLLHDLDPAKQPKLFIGYSDNTSIMTWLNCHAGVTALHGPMIDGRLARGASGYDESSFLALLQGGKGLRLAPDGLVVVRGGEAAGPMFGGTLTQLTASLATPYAFAPPDGCVLFLEDVNERPYRLDRMLTQLALSGILSRARALVFGEMRGCDEPDGRATALDVVRSFAEGFAGPVIFGFPSGHTNGPCWTLPLGVVCRVVTAPRPGVTVEESPVE